MTKIIEMLNDIWEVECDNCGSTPEEDEMIVAIIGDAVFEDAGGDIDSLPTDECFKSCRPCFEKLQPLIARHEKPDLAEGIDEDDDENDGN